jgi:hypothetical protein
MVAPRLIEILRTLHTHEVEFIVVGGMAAVIGGAPVVTRDVGVLRSRSPRNVERWPATDEQHVEWMRGVGDRPVTARLLAASLQTGWLWGRTP